jgi:hypothetical protein
MRLLAWRWRTIDFKQRIQRDMNTLEGILSHFLLLDLGYRVHVCRSGEKNDFGLRNYQRPRASTTIMARNVMVYSGLRVMQS